MHHSWINTFRHSVHVTLLFYREWHGYLFIVWDRLRVTLFVFEWSQLLFIFRCWSYGNSVFIHQVINVYLIPLLPTLKFQTLIFVNQSRIIVAIVYFYALFSCWFEQILTYIYSFYFFYYWLVGVFYYSDMAFLIHKRLTPLKSLHKFRFMIFCFLP